MGAKATHRAGYNPPEAQCIVGEAAGGRRGRKRRLERGIGEVVGIDARVQVAGDSLKPPHERLNAIDFLIRAGDFETAERLLPELAAIPELSAQVRRLQAVVRQLQRWGISSKVEAYRDPLVRPDGVATDFDAGDEVRIARRPGARKIVFVFTGKARQIWLSIHILHQILPADCTIVYLQDIRRCGYVFGLQAFGEGYAATLDGMRRLIESEGSPEVFVIGSSAGGWAAMRYALDLEATRVLAIAPATDLNVALEHREDLATAIAISKAEGEAGWPPGDMDLRALYASAARPPELILAFGGGHERDRDQCRRMAGLPHVTLHEEPGYDRHDVMAELIANGSFQHLIDALMRPARS